MALGLKWLCRWGLGVLIISLFWSLADVALGVHGFGNARAEIPAWLAGFSTAILMKWLIP